MTPLNCVHFSVRQQSGEVEDPGQEGEAPPLPPPDALAWNQAAEGKWEGKSEDGTLPPLPAECGADKHPVVVLHNVYTREDSDADPNFFDDLEVKFQLRTLVLESRCALRTGRVGGRKLGTWYAKDQCRRLSQLIVHPCVVWQGRGAAASGY